MQRDQCCYTCNIGGTAELATTVTAGRFNGDEILIASLRDPLRLLACLNTALPHTAPAPPASRSDTPAVKPVAP
jgi:hypothetical protein